MSPDLAVFVRNCKDKGRKRSMCTKDFSTRDVAYYAKVCCSFILESAVIDNVTSVLPIGIMIRDGHSMLENWQACHVFGNIDGDSPWSSVELFFSTHIRKRIVGSSSSEI